MVTSKPTQTELRRVFPGDGEMAGRMRDLDWTAHALGPPESWPLTLQTALAICLASRLPMQVWWGWNLTLLYNDAYVKFLGPNKHPSVLARSGREVWAEIWDQIGPMLERVFQDGVASSSEDIQMFFARALPNEEVFVTLSFSPIFGEDGAVEGVFGACVENTEKVIGARRLETLCKLGAATATTSVDLTCKAIAAVLDQNGEDVPCAALYLDEGSKLRAVSRVRLADGEAGLPATIEDGRFRDLNGIIELDVDIGPRHWPERVTRAVAVPIGSSGTPTAILVCGVSPRRPLDDEYRTFLERAASRIATLLEGARAFEVERCRAEQLAELDRAKTIFFSNISHELRTPLTLILGPIESLLGRSVGASLRDQLQLLQRNAIRLQKLVNSMLHFSRIEAGRARMEYEPTDLAKLTADLAATFRSLIEAAGMELAIDCEHIDEPAYVDRQAWEHVVLNLLSNAYKFTFEGKITVTLRREGELLRLEVQDTGTGIDPAHVEHVFDRFHRIEGVRSRSFEGSGIGLALVRELVNLHGGAVEVMSTLGQGSTFAVTLPLGHAHLSAEQLKGASHVVDTRYGDAFVNEAMAWPTEHSLVDRGNNRQKPRILLVDDNRDLQTYVTSLLAGELYVEAVSDGRTALDVARRNPPALVLTDIMIPDVDGIQLVRELRAEPLTADVPILILSARADEETRVEGLAAGADDYIIKPFSARELRARIRTQLELSTARVQIGEARAATRAKDDFLVLLGHELRNPLSVLSATVQTLLLKAPSAEADLMQRAVWQLARLVDDLLDMSRLSRGKVQLDRARVELALVLDRAQECVRRFVQERHTQILVDLPRAGLAVDCDAGRLSQAIANVIMNASKFSAPGSKVSVEAIRVDDRVRVRVADAGSGIEPSRLARVFDAFAEPDQAEGLGIGLAIARSLIELHDGTIRLDSAGVGHGTECTIELPVEAREASSRPSATARRPRKRILLVEDNHDTAMALKSGLEQLGYQVALAHDGPVALTVARSFQPDVALIDIGLPVMDGWELARRLREMRVPSRELHFVAVTALDRDADKKRSADAGFADHLVKPFDLTKLERVVESLPDLRHDP
jgi:signal transduction histidine kinase